MMIMMMMIVVVVVHVDVADDVDVAASVMSILPLSSSISLMTFMSLPLFDTILDLNNSEALEIDIEVIYSTSDSTMVNTTTAITHPRHHPNHTASLA